MRFVWVVLLSIGCGGGSSEAECVAKHGLIAPSSCPTPTEAKAAASEQKPNGDAGDLAVTAFEKELLSPMLEDIRAGVRPFGDELVGVCQGTGKVCEGFLGTDPGELAEGEYMLRGEFRAPKVGAKGTWKVKLETECVTTSKTASGESSKTDTRSREYDVVYAGEDRGYRLSPMIKITSPNKAGAVACTYVLTSLHPDAPTTIEGGWKVPAAP